MSFNSRLTDLLKKDRRYPNKHGYIGVGMRMGLRPRYRAYVSHEGRNFTFGTYDTPEEAARAHDEGAKRLQGEFANLNFPS